LGKKNANAVFKKAEEPQSRLTGEESKEESMNDQTIPHTEKWVRGIVGKEKGGPSPSNRQKEKNQSIRQDLVNSQKPPKPPKKGSRNSAEQKN